MALPLIYLFIIIAWAALLFAFYFDDYIIKSLVCIFLIVLGVFILINGIESINNIAVVTLGIIHIAIGFYIWVLESYKVYKTM